MQSVEQVRSLTVPEADHAGHVGPARAFAAYRHHRVGGWRAVNAPHLVALVRAGTTFVKGKLVERPAESPAIEDQSRAA
ncbi:hypothetical protein GCM10020001_115050 [Nonomuraea salmonea]